MLSIELKLLTEGEVTIDEAMLADFEKNVRGSVVNQNDDSYDEVRVIWNAMIDRKPGLIIQCAGSEDVVQAVRFARENQVLTSVRGGGHNIAGKALCDGGLLIDLSNLKAVKVDPERKTARVEPGATLADVDRETQAFGLALPVGINSTTGVAGLTLGGGFGWLSRKFGLTSDNLLSADVVTAEGSLVRCSSDENTDLFWAIRGGGGNFGIVTSFEFQLHPVDPEVLSGLIVHPFSAASEVLKFYREFTATTPDELTVWIVLRDAPPLPFLPEEVHGTKVLILATVYNGSIEDGEDALKELRDFGDPIADVIQPTPFAAFQQAFDPLLEPGARNYWKSHNFTELSDGLLDELLAYVETLPSPQSEIFIAQVGGQINRVAVEATAYPHRDAKFIMNVHTRWENSSQDAECIDWARKFYEACKPFSTGGVYMNFLSEGEEERIEGAYGQNFKRLMQVKSIYDPENLFRTNQNIRPAK